MSNPFNVLVMEKNFKPIVALISALNVLSYGIRSKDRFKYQVNERNMYITGLSCDLANLYTLLWAECDGYSFRFDRVDGDCVLECY